MTPPLPTSRAAGLGCMVLFMLPFAAVPRPWSNR